MLAWSILLGSAMFISLASGSLGEHSFFKVGKHEDKVEKICKSPNILSCHFIEVHFDVLWSKDFIIFCGLNFTKKDDIPVAEGFHSFGYRNGTNVTELANTAVLTFSKNGEDHTKLDGEINLKNGSSYVIENCGRACHVLMEQDTDMWKDTEPTASDSSRMLSPNERALLDRGVTDMMTIVTFSVMVYHTKQFRSHTADVELFVEEMLALANQAFMNSEIPVRVKVLCIEEATIDDTFDTDAFRDMKGSAAATRNTADAAVLLVSPGFGSYCGIAYQNTVANGDTFSIVRKDCAQGYYSFSHVLGHNFGCHHNQGTGHVNEHFSHGYGFLVHPPDNSGYRTIMSFYANGYRSRINYYSSATVKINGNWSIGDNSNDNARVITEQRFLMANIGNEENECVDATCEMTEWSNLDCPTCNCDCEPASCPAGTVVYSAQVQAVDGFAAVENITLGAPQAKQFQLTSTNNKVWLTYHEFKCYNAEQFHLDTCSPTTLSKNDAADKCCHDYRVRFCCRKAPSVALVGASSGYERYPHPNSTTYQSRCHYDIFELYSSKGTCNLEIAKAPFQFHHRPIVNFVPPNYIIACDNDHPHDKDCFQYHPSTNTWTSSSNLLPDRYRTSVVAGNKLYVIGGYYHGFHFSVWSPTTNEWQEGPEIPIPIHLGCAVSVNDRIYVFGGNIRYPNGTNLNGNLRIQIFDLKANQWTIGATAPHGLYDAGCVRIRNTNNILIAPGNGHEYVLLYDFSTDSFSKTGNRIHRVAKSSLVEIDNGRYLSIDGVQWNTDISRMAQEYHPESGKWSVAEQRFIRGRVYPGVTAVPAYLFKHLHCEA